MNREKISVVIPVHNTGGLLVEAVTSVRGQTMPVAEIIIVDDGSTDETPEVIGTLGAGVRAVRQLQGGAGAARNRGGEMATGDWLAFLDADDLWLPGKLAAQMAWMRAAPQTDVVFGHGCNFILAADGTRREEAPRPAFLPGAALLRQEYFLRRARFDEELKQNEAIGWFLQLQAGGAKIGVVPELVLLRRLHDANLRRQGDGGRPADLRLLRAWIQQRRQQQAGPADTNL